MAVLDVIIILKTMFVVSSSSNGNLIITIASNVLGGIIRFILDTRHIKQKEQHGKSLEDTVVDEVLQLPPISLAPAGRVGCHCPLSITAASSSTPKVTIK